MDLGEDSTEELFLAQVTLMETYTQLELAIQQLPKHCGRIIRLSLQSYTNTEIAEALGISKNTVKSQKRIAYEKLRHRLCGLWP